MHRAMMLALGAGLLTTATLPFADTAAAAGAGFGAGVIESLRDNDVSPIAFNGFRKKQGSSGLNYGRSIPAVSTKLGNQQGNGGLNYGNSTRGIEWTYKKGATTFPTETIRPRR